MSDYAVASSVDRLATQVAAVARAQSEIAKAMAEANKIELNRQKREWRAQGGTSDTFNFGG